MGLDTRVVPPVGREPIARRPSCNRAFCSGNLLRKDGWTYVVCTAAKIKLPSMLELILPPERMELTRVVICRYKVDERPQYADRRVSMS